MNAPARLDSAIDPPALAARRTAMLMRLAEIGMEIAEAAGLRARALAGGAAADGVDPALAYARAARAVSLALPFNEAVARICRDLGLAAPPPPPSSSTSQPSSSALCRGSRGPPHGPSPSGAP